MGEAHCYDPNEEARLWRAINTVGVNKFNEMIRKLATMAFKPLRSHETLADSLSNRANWIDRQLTTTNLLALTNHRGSMRGSATSARNLVRRGSTQIAAQAVQLAQVSRMSTLRKKTKKGPGDSAISSTNSAPAAMEAVAAAANEDSGNRGGEVGSEEERAEYDGRGAVAKAESRGPPSRSSGESALDLIGGGARHGK